MLLQVSCNGVPQGPKTNRVNALPVAAASATDARPDRLLLCHQTRVWAGECGAETKSKVEETNVLTCDTDR